ncbi:transposase [Flavobacterium sp. 140616W15]|uniref:transposase n=1 Tax=Flavobacterium sp. 140616W15 TaxID=2478552 RepID=UPI001F5E0AFB|nr:transposase [Flavobacterium sp. 140616W15]
MVAQLLFLSEQRLIRLLNISDKLITKKKNCVQEITLDIANSLKLISKRCFPKVVQVTDRFHVQKLALDALQELRIKYRWKTMDA